ncbi:hypothetical protein PISMIDRAFT_677919 [Pisolithus microcarpus 441]|uniref:Uncharacterized protein n=1 Tax=Pisolithus microcarpus 441 TaxID=765257 RepID=A0A0C9ZYJ5_9AGAM|nr:hypothetical protein PISMIDRAFT_677919 [Pisolithus microcarpus 441]
MLFIAGSRIPDTTGADWNCSNLELPKSGSSISSSVAHPCGNRTFSRAVNFKDLLFFSLSRGCSKFCEWFLFSVAGVGTS